MRAHTICRQSQSFGLSAGGQQLLQSSAEMSHADIGADDVPLPVEQHEARDQLHVEPFRCCLSFLMMVHGNLVRSMNSISGASSSSKLMPTISRPSGWNSA